VQAAGSSGPPQVSTASAITLPGVKSSEPVSTGSTGINLGLQTNIPSGPLIPKPIGGPSISPPIQPIQIGGSSAPQSYPPNSIIKNPYGSGYVFTDSKGQIVGSSIYGAIGATGISNTNPANAVITNPYGSGYVTTNGLGQITGSTTQPVAIPTASITNILYPKASTTATAPTITTTPSLTAAPIYTGQTYNFATRKGASVTLSLISATPLANGSIAYTLAGPGGTFTTDINPSGTATFPTAVDYDTYLSNVEAGVATLPQQITGGIQNATYFNQQTGQYVSVPGNAPSPQYGLGVETFAPPTINLSLKQLQKDQAVPLSSAVNANMETVGADGVIHYYYNPRLASEQANEATYQAQLAADPQLAQFVNSGQPIALYINPPGSNPQHSTSSAKYTGGPQAGYESGNAAITAALAGIGLTPESITSLYETITSPSGITNPVTDAQFLALLGSLTQDQISAINTGQSYTIYYRQPNGEVGEVYQGGFIPLLGGIIPQKALSLSLPNQPNPQLRLQQGITETTPPTNLIENTPSSNPYYTGALNLLNTVGGYGRQFSASFLPFRFGVADHQQYSIRLSFDSSNAEPAEIPAGARRRALQYP
jgi:hypothetical protein